MFIRYLVSSYLFLLGYGHFTHLWTTGDFSSMRVLKVLLRYNCLAVLLCAVMNRPYQFYYFAPLVSFWYLVIYLTLALPPRVSEKSVENSSLPYFYVVVKLVALFSIISLFYLSQVFFETVFNIWPWRILFVYPENSVAEWWFRWKLDRYSAPGGMVLAFLVIIARKYALFNDSGQSSLLSKRLTVACCVLAAACLTGYFGFMSRYNSKKDCNEIHSYVSFIPVLSYIVLRNACGCVRSRVSTLFAWFGRISLELFIAQYHIWLAADTHGVLVLFPRWPVFNVILTSFILVCVAHEIHELIGDHLTPLLLPGEPKLMLRNVAVLLLVVIPLAVIWERLMSL
jgi:hypothetical protein